VLPLFTIGGGVSGSSEKSASDGDCAMLAVEDMESVVGI